MSGPTSGRSFAERLDWLLATVPRTPGGTRRFTTDDLITALARVAPTGTPRRSSARVASEWLEARRRDDVTSPLDRASARFVAVLEDIFRLPIGYFQDMGIAAATDARITFAQEATAEGLRFIGPCRVMKSELTAEQLHELHAEAAGVLRRRRAAS